MLIIVLLFTIICAAILRSIHSKFARIIISLVVLYWDVSLIISTTNPYGMFEVSGYTYFLLALSIFCYIAGALSYNRRVVENINVSTEEFSYEWMLRNNVIKICYAISIILLGYLAIAQWNVVLYLGGAGSLKIDFFDLVFHRNSALYFIYKIIASPLFFLSLIIASILIVKKEKRKTLSLFIALFIVLFCFVGGKRGYYATSIIYISLCLFIIQKTSKYLKLKAKVFVKIATIFSAFIFAAIITTIAYTGLDFNKNDVNDTGGDLGEQFVTYNIGSFRLLDYALANEWDKNTPTLYGRATLGGCLDYYGCAVLQRLGVGVKQATEIGMDKLQNNFINISKDNYMNFAYTSLIYFMFDFGVLGIIIFSFFFGRFTQYSIILFERYKTIGSLLLMVYLLNGAQSFFQSWFNVALYAQPLIFLVFYLHKKELYYRQYGN